MNVIQKFNLGNTDMMFTCQVEIWLCSTQAVDRKFYCLVYS